MDRYYNRKKFFSINVLAVCDSDTKFLFVECKWPGSVHDSRVYRRSDLFDAVHNRGRNPNMSFLLADLGFPLTSCTLTPYKKPRGRNQRFFNKRLRQNRVIIEQAFGKLKARFPVLKYTILLHLKNISVIIVACFILQNMAVDLNERDFFMEEDDEQVEIRESSDDDEDGGGAGEFDEEEDYLIDDREQARGFREDISNRLL